MAFDLDDEELEATRKLNKARRNVEMSDYEQIVISAVRYALGRMTDIVENTVNYVLNEIEYDKLSDTCLKIIKRDIEEELKVGGMFDSDRRQWIKLKVRIEEVI